MHRGQQVAAKVFRMGVTDNFEIRRVSFSWFLPFLTHVSGLSVSYAEVLPGGCDMEDLSSSERAAVCRRDDDCDSVCDGVRVDGE